MNRCDYQIQRRTPGAETWVNFIGRYDNLVTAVNVINRCCYRSEALAAYEWRVVALAGVVWERALSISHG